MACATALRFNHRLERVLTFTQAQIEALFKVQEPGPIASVPGVPAPPSVSGRLVIVNKGWPSENGEGLEVVPPHGLEPDGDRDGGGRLTIQFVGVDASPRRVAFDERQTSFEPQRTEGHARSQRRTV
jgi:hypothetical protein